MTKEDKQLCCSVSYHEIGTATWSLLKKPLFEQLPLHNVSWVSPSSAAALVQKLDIRFTRDSPELFRDSDHPFRWFMAPFCSVCFVSTLNLETYKQECRPAIRNWIETSFAPHKRAPTQWLIAFVTVGTESPKDVQDKVYNKVAADVGTEKSIHLYLHTGGDQIVTNMAKQKRTLEALFSQMRKCLQNSFYQRVSLYEAEIQRLNSSNPSIDFRQLFLVQESLALLYQLSFLPGEALRQYAELDTLINTAAVAGNVGVGVGGIDVDDDSFAEAWFRSELSTAEAISAHVHKSRSCGDAWAVGAAILDYSINDARMRILKSNIKPLELKSYVFARQMYFLSSVSDSTGRATRATATLHFVQSLHSIVGGHRSQQQLQQQQQQQQRQTDHNADCWNIYMLSVISAVMRDEKAMECTDGPCLEDVMLLQFACSRLHSLSKYRHFPLSSSSSSSSSSSLHEHHVENNRGRNQNSHPSDIPAADSQKGHMGVLDHLAWCRSRAFNAAMTLKTAYPDPAMQMMTHTTPTDLRNYNDDKVPAVDRNHNEANLKNTMDRGSVAAAAALYVTTAQAEEDENLARQLLGNQGAADGVFVSLHEAILAWDKDDNDEDEDKDTLGNRNCRVVADGSGVAGVPSQDHQSCKESGGITSGLVTAGGAVASMPSAAWYSRWGLLSAKLLHVIAHLEMTVDKR